MTSADRGASDERPLDVLPPDVPHVVLASASPRRSRLLAELGVAFEVRPSDVDETPPDGLTPEQIACLLAQRKAHAAVADPAEVVLAADTLVVAHDGTLLGKPCDDEAADRSLALLSGTRHRVVTGVCLLRRHPQFERTVARTTFITMRAISAEERRAYVASGEPFGKAGGYAIQEHGDRFVTRVEGSWSNVVGLPTETVRELLTELAQSSP